MLRSSIEAGKLDLERLPLDLHDEWEQLRRVFSAPAARKGLGFTIETDIVPPFFVQTDPTRLRQVLINRVGSALKFTAQGEVTVAAIESIKRIGSAAPRREWMAS